MLNSGSSVYLNWRRCWEWRWKECKFEWGRMVQITVLLALPTLMCITYRQRGKGWL